MRSGYRIRCIVRSEGAIESLRRGPALQEFATQIDYLLVPDNTVPDSYDSALANVQYVIHVAGVWPTPVSASQHICTIDLPVTADKILWAFRTSTLITTSISLL